MNQKNEVETLQWDSDFFGIKVGRYYNDQRSIDSVNTHEHDLVYIYSKKILDNNIPLYDKKITFEKEIHPTIDDSTKSDVIPYNGKLNKDLIQLAIASGQYSRFKLDPKLSNRFEELFTLWIANSVNGKIADFVLVYKKEGKIIGFITLKKSSSHFQIGLIAISSENRGLGIGSQLMKKAEQIAKSEKIYKIRVVTQLDNKIACNFYQKNGYQIINKEYIYHYWS